MCEALLKQYYSGQAHSLAMKNRLNESFENDRAVSRRLRRPKPRLEKDSWQSYRLPFEVLFGMSIMSLLWIDIPQNREHILFFLKAFERFLRFNEQYFYERQ